jgi:hypothetical protein
MRTATLTVDGLVRGTRDTLIDRLAVFRDEWLEKAVVDDLRALRGRQVQIEKEDALQRG